MAKKHAVIIGGGIIGASCAYYLAKSGLSVTLMDKGGLCTEASKASQGHLFLWELPPVNVILARESKKLYMQLIDELDVDLEFRPTGSMSIAETPESLVSLAQTCEQLQAIGVDCEVLDRATVLRREPNLSTHITGGASFPEDAQLNPLIVTIGLVEGARKWGATIRLNTEVIGIQIDNSQTIKAVETNNGTIQTDYVVNAAGAWSGMIADMANLHLPVMPRKGILMVLDQVPQDVMNCKIIMASGYLDSLKSGNKTAVAANIQQTRGGNVLLGSSRAFAGFDKVVNPEVISEMARRCLRFFPCLKGMQVIRSWAGLRPYSPDMIPIISDTKVKGFYVASGHEGVGITMAPITGLLISQLINNQTPLLPLEPLSINRFDPEISA